MTQEIYLELFWGKKTKQNTQAHYVYILIIKCICILEK